MHSILWNDWFARYSPLLHWDCLAPGHCMSLSSSGTNIQSDGHVFQSILFRFTILRTFRLLRVFRPFRYNSMLLLWVYTLACCATTRWPRAQDYRSNVFIIQTFTTRSSRFSFLRCHGSCSIQYTSVRQDKHHCGKSSHTCLFRYFAERGTWDESLGTFINTDGDPSQFAVSFQPARSSSPWFNIWFQSIPAAAWYVFKFYCFVPNCS